MEYTDTIKLNRGINKDGAFWCQNIRPATDDGVFAGISMTNIAKRVANTPTSTMGGLLAFTQIGDYPYSTIFAKDDIGDIYYMTNSGQSITKTMDYSLTAGVSEGLMIDTNGTLVYTGSQYIGREYHTTLNGTVTIDANTIELTSATNFPSSGYGFIAESGHYEVIQWTGKSSNQLTGVTRGEYYSTASAHATGVTVYYFKDDWKDLGASLTLSTRRCITWDVWNFFVNGNVVTGYSAADASDIKTCLTLASDKTIVDFGLLPTSSTSYVLIGANSGENGYIYTWDGKDTISICEKELKNNNITRMWENYVATDNGIYQYDGTNLNLIVSPSEDIGSIRGGRFEVKDMKTVKNYLLYTGGLGVDNRNRKGFWYVDLDTKDSYFVASSYYGSINYMYGIFPTSSLILVGSSFNNGALDLISELPASRGSVYQFYYKPDNAKTFRLKGLKLNVSLDSMTVRDSSDDVYFDVIVRGFNFSKGFVGRSQLMSGETPTGSSQIIIPSTLFIPSVGDRLEIQGLNSASYVNSAGAPRNITAVTAVGGTKYTIDVDDAFPVAINNTTQGSSAEVIFNPLKKLGKISVNSTQLNLDGYSIPLSSQPLFKKMIFEIEVRCGDITIAPQLNSMEITYTDSIQ